MLLTSRSPVVSTRVSFRLGYQGNGVEQDHVTVQMIIPPNNLVSTVMGALKRLTSRRLREKALQALMKV